MVKHFNQELRAQEYTQTQKITQKIQFLRRQRKIDLIKDTKRNCLKRNIVYQKPKFNIVQFIAETDQEKLNPKFDQTLKEVHSYKVALRNTQKVLNKLEEMKIKNQRPADYLVQMYKSDKQMFKVRRYLTEKQEKLKQKMQGKDWQSKNKKKQKAKKKAQAKRQKKKSKMAQKRKFNNKPSKIKINGKNKIKKSQKK